MRVTDAHLGDHGRRYSAIFLGFSTASIVGLTAVGLLGLRVNLTGSIPVGMYHVVGDATELHRGDVVLACLPARTAALAHARGYIPGGGRCAGGTAPVGKLVMALPGDTVMVGPAGLAVNGATVQWSRPLDHDRGGRPLPHLSIGRSLVDADAIWLIGSSSYSFDSRYFGAIPKSNVLVRVRSF